MRTQKIVNNFGTVLIEKPYTEVKSQKELVELAVKEGVALRAANLSAAQLDYTNLRDAELRHANLVETNLVKAILADADLTYANLYRGRLFDAVLQRARLTHANLSSASLTSANLHGARLLNANLTCASLTNTNLTFCYLVGANLKHTALPSPTMVLLAEWGHVSNELTADLMVWDSLNHPDPTTFDRWANGGSCPYSDTKVQRAAHFKERQELWGKGKVCSPYELMQRVLAEKCPPWTREQEQEFDHQFNTEVKGATE